MWWLCYGGVEWVAVIFSWDSMAKGFISINPKITIYFFNFHPYFHKTTICRRNVRWSTLYALIYKIWKSPISVMLSIIQKKNHYFIDIPYFFRYHTRFPYMWDLNYRASDSVQFTPTRMLSVAHCEQNQLRNTWYSIELSNIHTCLKHNTPGHLDHCTKL